MELSYRFKPKNTQTVSGQDVAIGVTMAPLQDAPIATPCPCAPESVSWAIQQSIRYNPTPPETKGGLSLPTLDYFYPVENPEGGADLNAQGRPIVMRVPGVPWYTSYPPTEIDPIQKWIFLGLPFGDANGIRWEWEWEISGAPATEPEDPLEPSYSNWWRGQATAQVGNFLQVEILEGNIYSYLFQTDFEAWLIAKAFCGSTEVGELRLHIFVPSNLY